MNRAEKANPHALAVGFNDEEIRKKRRCVMITGDKLRALLDNADKTDRDLIRYVCNGLRAYDVNQVPITDPIKREITFLEAELAGPKLPGVTKGFLGYEHGPLSLGERKRINEGLETLSKIKVFSLEILRDNLRGREMSYLAQTLVNMYYERQDVESYTRPETPKNGEVKQASVMTQAHSAGAGWCYGRKDICDHLGVSWSTVRRHKYPLLVEEGSNRPMQNKQALDAHRQARSRKKKK